MVQLTVTPEWSLADSSVWIRVFGLTPSQQVTLHVSLVDEKGVKFEARAFYCANEAGEVDVKEASALGGDYSGVCPMGLFWSLKPEKMFHRLIKRDVIGSPFHIRISLLDTFLFTPSATDTPLATCSIERWFVAPGVKRFQIKEGQVRGALFLPPGKEIDSVFSSLPTPVPAWKPSTHYDMIEVGRDLNGSHLYVSLR